MPRLRCGAGFSSPPLTQESEDVDRHVDDDPHDVHEMPVDASDLDPVVVLGGEVASEGANGHEEQDAQSDEDMGPVQAGEAEEDGREGAVGRVEPDARVLDRLGDEERQAHQERQEQAGAQAPYVAALDRLQRPVHGEARRDEDARVDEGDVDRQVERRCRPRRPVHDAHEEVRGEERAEEHDLRRDEEEHPEHAGGDPRAEVRRGRSVVLEVLCVRRHYAVTPAGASTSTWSTGSFVSVRRRSTRSRRSQPERACGNVDTISSSTRSSSVAWITAVYGSGWAICPWASRPSDRSRVTARSRRFSASSYEPPASPCGDRMRKLAGPCCARARIRSSSSSPSTVWLATTSTFAGPCSLARSTTTCSNGRSPATRRIWSTALRRSQPDFCCGCVETITSSGSSCSIASRTAATGSDSTTTPVAGTLSLRSSSSVLSSRRRAAALRVAE